MKYIRWGILTSRQSGADDEMATKVAEIIGRIDGSSVVKVIDVDKDDAIDALDNPDINAILVATTPQTHATYSVLAMNAAKPVVIAQPIAFSYADCLRINATQDKTKQPCFVLLPERMADEVKRLKQRLRDEEIGNVLAARYTFFSNDYNTDNREPLEAIFRRRAASQIDTLQYLLGLVIDAKGLVATDDCRRQEGIGLSVSATLMFEDGFVGSMLWSLGTSQQSSKDELIITGEKGELRLENLTFPTSNSDTLLHDTLRSIVEDLQGFGRYAATSLSATPALWVTDRILRQ